MGHYNLISLLLQYFSALNVDHEIQAQNYLPATDIKRGWVIDSGASAHMTPYKRDCKDIQQTYRKNIFSGWIISSL